jgi:ATP-dependent Clp protease adaptor protein ClpS
VFRFLDENYDLQKKLRPLSSQSEIDEGGGTAVAESRPAVRTPPMYRVLLMNDDFTPMDFVVHILQKFFSKQIEEATKIMLEVHHKGAGVCGVFTHEIAETKVHLVNTYAKQNRFPLKCTMEKAET